MISDYELTAISWIAWQVIVLGKPSAPEGPLDVKDIYEDHCTLEWKPPADDGGIPVDHVSQI